MSEKVSVLLLETIPAVGVSGSIVEVSDGYARNFLFPQGKAALATPEKKQQKAAADAKLKKETQAKLEELQATAQKLDNTELTIIARVKEGDEIYGKITAKHIASELQAQAKMAFTVKQIDLPKPLTRLGSTPVTLKLSADVSATIHVVVSPDPSVKKTNEEEA
jgi:large subunit ribosomal protein L9